MTATLPSPTITEQQIARSHTLIRVRGRTDLLLPLVIGIGSFLPLVVEFFLNLNARPHYQFFPLVLIAAGLLGMQRLNLFAGWRTGYSRTAIAMFIVASIGLVLGTFIHSPWVGYASLLVYLFGMLHAWGGGTLVRRLLPVGILFTTLLPPPLSLDSRLIAGLQHFASAVGSQCLDAMQVPHLVSGNTIVVRTKHLFIEEACSGIHSLTSVLAVTLIYLVLLERHWLHSLLVLALALIWVLAANIVRILAITLAEDWRGIDISTGPIHYLLGVALFAGCLGLVISSDCLFRLFTRPKPVSEMPPLSRRPSPQRADGWVAIRRCLAGIGIVCFLLGVARAGSSLFQRPSSGEYPLILPEDAMPERAGAWIRLPGGPVNTTRTSSLSHGDFSSAWSYRADRWNATIAIDYPFPNWHDLTVCYRGRGWEVRREETIKGPIGNFKVIDLTHPELGDARLYYTATDAAGRQPDLPVESFGGSFMERFSISLAPPRSDFFQVQLLLRGGAPGIPPATDQSARALFEEIVRSARRHLPGAENFR